jgi:L-lactate dehydrogenase
MNHRKIVILGAGHVGTHCALSLMFRGLATEIVLIDTDEEKAKSQALDLDDMGACLPVKTVIRAGSYKDLDDAKILVNAVGRSRREGETRLDMFGDSMERLNDIVPKIKHTKFQGILISITNPADVVGECLRKELRIDRFRCFSTGTSLDSLRIKRILEEKTGYHRNSIDAFCMGEHGDSQIVPLSHVSIGGKSFARLQKENPDTLGKITIEQLQDEVRQAGMIVITGKKSTEFGIGIVLSDIVKSIFHDEKRIWPLSVHLDGEYGQKDVAAGVPVVIGAGGIEEIVEMDLTEEEEKQFSHSCDVIRGYLKKAEELLS